MNQPRLAADPELVSAVGDFFAEQSGHEIVARAEQEGMPAKLWTEASALGLHLVGIPENRGGSGGALPELLAVLRLAARNAAPLPLAETHLAAWLLAESGIALPSSAECLTIAPGNPSDRLRIEGERATGTLSDVPWAKAAARVVALVSAAQAGSGHLVVSVDPAACERRGGFDLAGQPRDHLTLVNVPVEVTHSPHGPDALLMRGALLRAAQIAGAIEAASALTQNFTAQRVQFGKPVSAFQAVQQHLVTLAQAAAMTAVAVDRAGFAAAQRPASFEICAAKVVANDSAAMAAAAAHQAHGAVGMTREYRLQQFTRRLSTWRAEFGTSEDLEPRLGGASPPAASFSRLITDASAPEL